MTAVAVFLAIELVDELVDGARGAALPLMRGDLHLSYADIGLLLSLPIIVGNLVEAPLGILADRGWRRRLILAGGAGFVTSLALVATAQTFWMLVAGFTLFYPSSGAFVTLAQASLMDLDGTRHEANMARWNFAGAVGAVAGSFLLAGLIALHLGWRTGFALLVLASLACVLAAARVPGMAGKPEAAGESLGASLRAAVDSVRRLAVVRWLLLLECSDLMLDVFTGFLAVFLVDVAHASPAAAAAAVGIRLGADLFGGLLVIPMVERLPGKIYLRMSAALLLALYPAFLLVPWLPVRLVILVAVSLCTAGWYPLLMAGVYSSMPGRSGTVMSVTDVFNMVGGVLPAAIGLLAARAGLPVAMWVLLLSPLAILLGTRGHRSTPPGPRAQRS